uniref:Bm14280, isoform b n=1 Tax=Brugia malayi TaxID=6279 RepID=A0A1I9G4J4_BRUMA|nr:Bm14280, isoform b [Brugia malayi]
MMVWCMWCILKKEEVDDIVRIILETVQDFGNLKVAFKCTQSLFFHCIFYFSHKNISLM